MVLKCKVDLNIPTTIMDSNVIMDNAIVEPRGDMEFDSHEDAYTFYKEYAKSVGFGTAKLSSRRSRASREFIDAKFSCIRYGNKQQSDDAINPRPSPKIGCKASMHVKRRQNGKWYIYSFVKEHNHELLPAQAHFFRSHRNADPLKNDVRVRRRKNLAAVSKLFSAYQNEAKANFDAWHETPELKSPSPFEKQMSLVYTHEIFKKFQVEVLGAAACHLKKENEDETITIYTVKDFEDNQNYAVEWNESKLDIYCSCRSFEYKGYLCRHAIVVLQMSGVFNIPSKYILQRWTNAAKSRHSIGERLDEVQSKVRRFNDLCRRAIILGEEGSLSPESYNIALCAIKEALKQCAIVNNPVENDTRNMTSTTPAICAVEVNQFGNSSNEIVLDPKVTNGNKAPRRAGAGKEVASNENSSSNKGKVPQPEAVNVGIQDGFLQMEMSDMRPAQLHNQFHNVVPTQLHNLVPTMFHNVASTQFHNVASTNLHENRLPR
ncbi:protein far1-related sequence 4 [Quercus suber]|uniref:Protein FAR1-RELATED SEQUENCE n=1 Tax=Quercus suber TaxID=58331 RepID=A0AAW0M5N6_QUESU